MVGSTSQERRHTSMMKCSLGFQLQLIPVAACLLRTATNTESLMKKINKKRRMLLFIPSVASSNMSSAKSHTSVSASCLKPRYTSSGRGASLHCRCNSISRSCATCFVVNPATRHTSCVFVCDVTWSTNTSQV